MTDSATTKRLVLVLDTYAGFWHTFFLSLADRVLSTSRQRCRIETKTHVFLMIERPEQGRGYDPIGTNVYDTGRHKMSLEDLCHFVKYRPVEPTELGTMQGKKRISFAL